MLGNARVLHNERTGYKVSGRARSGVREFDAAGVAPELLEIVKPPGFGVKDVDDRVAVVQADPLGVLEAFDMERVELLLRTQPALDVARDPPDLGRGIPLANDEIIDGGVVDLAQVEEDDVLALDVGDTVDNEVVEAADGRLAGGRFADVDQMRAVLMRKPAVGPAPGK